ncbi:MAG TPA: prolyl oligopeptidase family serine peptidase [Pirellulales bacterium]|nr:prolyl oligopeptidase family serine peptidase [Pirellulales bacterium]
MWLPTRNACLAGLVLLSIEATATAQRDAAEDEAVEAIIASGGVVGWDQKHCDLPVAEVDFSNVSITDDALVHLAFVRNLRKLRLTKTAVTSLGLEKLRGLTSLESLDLAETQVTDDDLAIIANLPSLRVVDLSSTKITDAGLAHLTRPKNLESLAIASSQVGGDGLRRLAACRSLKRLDMYGLRLKDCHLAHLRYCRKLEWLSLERTQVTDDGLVHLRSLTRLRALDLDFTRVSDKGLKHLRHLTNLRHLGYNGTGITENAIKLLPRCATRPGVFLLDSAVEIGSDDELRESPEIQEVRAGNNDGLFSIEGLPQHSYSMNVEYEHGTLVPLRCLGTVGFIIKPKGPVDPDNRWIWVSNLFLAVHWSDGGGVVHRFPVERALERGFHVVGVDVGTSLGSPACAEIYQKFYELIRGKYGLNRRARMIGHSNGGLITLGWAFRHPEQVDRVLGIFPATDLRSWPGIDRVCGPGAITPAGLAYGLDRDQLQARLKEFNPIDNLEPLAKAGVKIYHIHGTGDDVVPIGPNSVELARRYGELGGGMEIEAIEGGKHGGPEFYSSKRALDFLLE